MDANQVHTLALRETDVEGALRRLCGQEELYVTCLKRFLDDPTIGQLNSAVKTELWDDAFTAAHALKGLAGNLGFIPLMHAVAHLIIIIRGGRTRDVAECMAMVNSSYRDITDAIRFCFVDNDTNGKGESA